MTIGNAEARLESLQEPRSKGANPARVLQTGDKLRWERAVMCCREPNRLSDAAFRLAALIRDKSDEFGVAWFADSSVSVLFGKERKTLGRAREELDLAKFIERTRHRTGCTQYRLLMVRVDEVLGDAAARKKAHQEGQRKKRLAAGSARQDVNAS